MAKKKAKKSKKAKKTKEIERVLPDGTTHKYEAPLAMIGPGTRNRMMRRWVNHGDSKESICKRYGVDLKTANEEVFNNVELRTEMYRDLRDMMRSSSFIGMTALQSLADRVAKDKSCLDKLTVPALMKISKDVISAINDFMEVDPQLDSAPAPFNIENVRQLKVLIMDTTNKAKEAMPDDNTQVKNIAQIDVAEDVPEAPTSRRIASPTYDEQYGDADDVLDKDDEE